LYDYQDKNVKPIIEKLKSSGGGIFKATCAFGKTTCGIYIACQLKVRTLILADQLNLLTQWKKEIECFTNGGASVGFCYGKKCELDCDFILATIQSVSKKEYDFSNVGFVIIDECHSSTSGQVYSKAFFKLSSRYMLGLSATPNKSDTTERVVKLHIGDIIHEFNKTTKATELPAIINIYKLEFEYKEFFTELPNGETILNFSQMLSDLVCNEPRNQFIVNLLVKCLENNRNVLVVSDRRNHLTILKKMIDHVLNSTRNTNLMTKTCGLYIGGMKEAELSKNTHCDIILATFKIFGKGISIKKLDTIMLTTPKKYVCGMKTSNGESMIESGNLEQVIFRIFRKEYETIHPVIIDLQDQFSVYKSHGNQRRRFYKQMQKKIIIEHSDQNIIFNQK